VARVEAYVDSPVPKEKGSPVVVVVVAVLPQVPERVVATVPLEYAVVVPNAEPVCWAGGPRMMLPAELVETVGLAELVVLPLDLPARTENWVEYWNSPVPSTMINIPYPVSVDCLPGARSLGTDHW